MQSLLFTSTASARGSLGILLLRLAMGMAFLSHGWPKIHNPTGWMGPQASVPGTFQALAAIAEFGGGIGLILGLLTPLAALGVAAKMSVAIATVHVPMGHAFVGKPGDPGPSSEPAVVYLAYALLILFLGPGSYSADACLIRKRVP